MHMVSLTQLFFVFPYHNTAKLRPQPKHVHLWCKQNSFDFMAALGNIQEDLARNIS